jgi:hypothetical protein
MRKKLEKISNRAPDAMKKRAAPHVLSPDVTGMAMVSEGHNRQSMHHLLPISIMGPGTMTPVSNVSNAISAPTHQALVSVDIAMERKEIK